MHRRLLALTRGPRLSLLLTLLAGLLAGWLTIAQARGLSLVVTRVFPGGQRWEDVRSLLMGLLVVIGLRALLAWVSEVSANSVAVTIKQDLRSRLFSRIEALGPAFTRRERTGELVAAALEGVEALDAYFSQYLPQLVLAALVPLSILIFVLPIDLLSGVILLVTAPLIPVFMILIGKGAEAVTRRQYETLSHLSAHFLDSLQGLTTLKIFGRSKAHARSIAVASDRFRDVTLSVLRVTFLSALALELIATLSTAVVAVEVGLRLLYGNLPFDKALFLLILAPEFYIPLRMLGVRFHAGMAGTTAARRIFELLDMDVPPAPVEAGKTVHLIAPFSRLQCAGLTFSYPGEAEPVLQNVSFEMKAGERLALVGPSGAGKSTLAALLLRFLKPQAGDILLDGRSIYDLPVEAWREMIAWVPQHPHLFHDTIAANLRIARPQATQEQLEAAARAARLDGFVRSLPAGYETIIGEEGARLSGGQAQRLALARAFLKDAPVLLLDEPTSSLDPQTEALLEESTRLLMQGRTVITIAHRLNTVTAANRIIVLQESCIVESGSHHELAAAGGLYARMFMAQGGVEETCGNSFAWLEEQAGDAAGAQAQAWQAPSAGSLPPRQERSLPVFRQLLGFLRGAWGSVALSVLLGALTIASSIGLMGASSWLIATAALHPSIAELNVAIVGVRFFGISRGVLRYLERLVSHGVTFRLLAQLRVWFYEKLEPLAPRRLQNYRAGDLLNRIMADVEMLENFYVRALAPPLVGVVISGGMALFMGSFHSSLGWAYLVAAILIGLALPLLSLELSRVPGGELTALRAVLRTQGVDYLQGLPDLLAFGRSVDFREQIAVQEKEYGRAQKRLAQASGMTSALGVLVSNLGMWVVLVLSIPLVSSGKLDGVLLAVLALMTQASFEALLPLSPAAQMLTTSLASARRLFEVVSIDPPMHLPAQSARVSVSGPVDLSVTRLSFTYPGMEEPALAEVSFELPWGKKVALVGPSGAGKSTLLNLMLRFWDAPSGCIHLAGGDLLDLPEETARAFFGVITQRTYLFDASLRENLRLADPDASQAEVEQAARQAQIHEFITRLPEGYATLAGEGGGRFSGGERQRLAIARTLLKNAPILLLDEPTENLDPQAAGGIMTTLLEIASDRSLLLITHHLSGLEVFDEILVLDRGRLVERGSHAALIRSGGLYQHMVGLQGRIREENR